MNRARQRLLSMARSLGLTLLLSVGLAYTTQAAVQAPPSGCKTDSKQIEDTYNLVRDAYKKHNMAMPDDLLLGDAAEIDQAPSFQRSVYLEVYVKAKPGFFRLLPGTGIGVEFQDDTVVYACLELNKNDQNNHLFITFLGGPGFFGSKYSVGTLKLEWRPIGEASLLLSGPLTLVGLGNIESKVSAAAENGFYNLFGSVLNVGVQQVVMEPNQVTFGVGSKLLGFIKLPQNNVVHKFDSTSWMLTHH